MEKELNIQIENICKEGFRVISALNSHFTEVQGIHYGQTLIVIRNTPEGVFGRRAKMNYSTTDKKILKSVWDKWEEIPATSELVKIK